jgi:hypothetical protein
MSAEVGIGAKFGQASGAAKPLSRLRQDDPDITLFLIIIGVLTAGSQALWLALLGWLVVRPFF